MCVCVCTRACVCAFVRLFVYFFAYLFVCKRPRIDCGFAPIAMWQKAYTFSRLLLPFLTQKLISRQLAGWCIGISRAIPTMLHSIHLKLQKQTFDWQSGERVGKQIVPPFADACVLWLSLIGSSKPDIFEMQKWICLKIAFVPRHYIVSTSNDVHVLDILAVRRFSSSLSAALRKQVGTRKQQLLAISTSILLVSVTSY